VTKDGETIFSGNIALSNNFDSYGYYRYIGFLDIDESQLSLGIISPSFNATDPMIPDGQLAVLAYKNGEELGVHLLEKDTPLEIDDIELTFLYDSQYSGFQVNSDPGNTLVWIACTLFIIGLVMVFYFPHSQLWILIRKKTEKQYLLYIRLMAPRAINSSAELNSLTSDITEKTKKRQDEK
jgi:cytochrome c biogenesis protein ResB